MKSFLAALLIAVPALAHAYTWDQTLQLGSVSIVAPTLTSPGVSYSFTHDLTLPGVGFVVGSDTITDYNLTLSLHNDQGDLDIVTIDQPGNIFTDGFALLWNWKAASVTTRDSYEGILSLTDTGLLSITVNSLFGSFFLDTSQLVAVGEKGPSAAVPEPASVALLAVGLIGIAVMRRTSRAA